MRASNERGQALPLIAVVIVVICAAIIGMGRVSSLAVDRARARTAADASALAGAREGLDRADDIAEANGAQVVAIIEEGRSVEVTVRVGDATATARAVRE